MEFLSFVVLYYCFTPWFHFRKVQPVLLLSFRWLYHFGANLTHFLNPASISSTDWSHRAKSQEIRLRRSQRNLVEDFQRTNCVYQLPSLSKFPLDSQFVLLASFAVDFVRKIQCTGPHLRPFHHNFYILKIANLTNLQGFQSQQQLSSKDPRLRRFSIRPSLETSYFHLYLVEPETIS